VCGDRCAVRKRVATDVGLFPAGSDEDRAKRLFGRACELGLAAACVHMVTLKTGDDFAAYAKWCTATLPIACAVAVHVAGSADDLRPLRAALAEACKTSPRAYACNALAYLEETGRGGGKRPDEALRHHLRACQLYSVASCDRLLLGPFGQPAAPKGLDADRFATELATDCDEPQGEHSCLALAAAYERGWVVRRDRERARDARTRVCGPAQRGRVQEDRPAGAREGLSAVNGAATPPRRR
jgi:TPR repeat protein